MADRRNGSSGRNINLDSTDVVTADRALRVLNRTLRDSSSSSAHLSRNFSSLQGNARNAGNAFSFLEGFARKSAIALGIVSGAQALLGRGAIQLASGLVESAQKFDVTFGPAAQRVGRYVEETHRRFGFFTGDLKDSLALLGTYGRSIGLQGDQLGDFAIGLQQAALDISSLFNASIEDVNRAIASGLVGEPEPLRRFGIFVSDALVRERAAAQGLTGDLTDAQKTFIRSQLIIEQYNAAAAKGDLARTANSPANQARNLAGRLKELSAIAGGLLLGSFGGTLIKINRYLDGVEERGKRLIPVIRRAFATGNLRDAARGFDEILGTRGRLVGFFDDLFNIGRSFGQIFKNDVIPIAQDVAGVLVVALSGLRGVLDFFARNKGLIESIAIGFLAWKAVAFVGGIIDGLRLKIDGLTAANQRLAASNFITLAIGAGLEQQVNLAQEAQTPAGQRRQKKSFLGRLFENPFDRGKGSPGRGAFGGGKGGFLGIGDTSSPVGGNYVTSNRRNYALGSFNSDHATGRAFDIAGPSIQALGGAINRGGGYARLHGSGAGRHLHAVPAGDTSTPVVVGGGGGTMIGAVNVTVNNPAAGIDIAKAVQQGIERREREKARRAPSG